MKARQLFPIYMSLLIGIPFSLGAYALYKPMEKSLRVHIDAVTFYQGRAVELLIRESLQNRSSAIDRMAHRWSEDNGIQREKWNADVTLYLANMPGFKAIEWVGSNLQTNWVKWPAAKTKESDSAISEVPNRANITVAKARTATTSVITKPFQLVSRQTLIAVYSPVFRNTEFDGLIIGIIDVESWLNSLFQQIQETPYAARVLLEGKEVLDVNLGAELADSEWAHTLSFETLGLTWNAIITPNQHYISANYTRLLNVMLLVCVFLVITISALTYLAITAKRRAKQLRQTANQMSTFFSNLHGIAYRCLNTPEWPMQFISDGCLQLTGFCADDFIQGRQSWRSLIHPDDRDAVWQAVQCALDKGGLFELEYRIRSKTNTQLWVKERGQVVDPLNDHVVHLEGIITDITERKKADFDLDDTRSFSDAVVENAAEAVISVDGRGNIETFNRAAQKMFGYSGTSAHGRNIRSLISGADNTTRSKKIEDYLTRRIKPPIEGLEFECLNADGTIFPVLISFSIVKNHGEKKFVALVRDLSRQRAAETQLREQQDLLAHLDRLYMFGEMSMGIAHEVNQPITAISIYAQAGKRLLESNKQDRLAEVFDKISEHTKRAGDVVERIQAMTRRQKSTLKIENCNTLIQETAELAKAESQTKNITIELTLDQQRHNVLVDRIQIQQVILNLLRNGMESMKLIDCRYGNKIKLVTRLCRDNCINIEVIDSGTGIPADIQDSLFTPFTSNKITGLGMGLSISQSIVTNHDGHLSFNNNPTCGATFRLTLPLANKRDVDE